jgi:hypothetical protein
MPLAALLLPLAFAQGPQLVIPKERWVPICFESVDERAEMSQLPSLRQTLLSEGDIEVRIWDGFDLRNLEGVVLRKRNQTWTAHWLPPTPPTKKELAASVPISLLSKEFEDLWSALQKEGILTLPDDSELPKDGMDVVDGGAYVVEYQKQGIYRTYRYDSPSFHRTRPEAKRILQIASLLQETLKIAPLRIAHRAKLRGKGSGR